jgi:hypothetical protein
LSITTLSSDIVIGSSVADAAAKLAVRNELEEATLAMVSRPVLASSASLPPGGIAIADGLWQRFDLLARLTYVPASETSRLAGAGAGLLDND